MARLMSRVPIIGCVFMNMEIRVFQRKRVKRHNDPSSEIRRTGRNVATRDAPAVHSGVNPEWHLDNIFTHFSLIRLMEALSSVHLIGLTPTMSWSRMTK